LVAEAVAPSRTVFNPRFEEGLGSSIACGARATDPSSAGFQPVSGPEASDGYLIALADMPSLRSDVVRRLLEAFESAPLDAILAPVYSDEPDRPGHPVIFGSGHLRQLQLLDGDQGARPILLAHPEAVRLIAIEGALEDMDLPTS
jgi:molybdenum cofactor cytidylyltransferase